MDHAPKHLRLHQSLIGAGVLVVGLTSLLLPQDYPDSTVWSDFGAGYGFIPLVLPLVGLWWWLRGSHPHR